MAPASSPASDTVLGYAPRQNEPTGHVYNEAAFRHFLAIDRRRVERSMRSLLLVLITVRRRPTPMSTFTEDTASAIFAALSDCVRDADFIGWYRDGRVAAAALAQGTTTPVAAGHRVSERIVDALTKRLTSDQLTNVRIRIIPLTAKIRT